MSEQRINAALEEATDTRDVNIGAGALASVPEVFRENFGEGPTVVVADGNTFEVAGREVQRELEDAGYTMMEPYVFPAEPPLYAEYSNIEKLRDSLREHDAIPVAVGSGTLNDIVKRSSHECERPYMCVGTAASMDGYTAFGASIEKDGLKQTLSCPAPRAVVADLEILQNAPENMRASGYADLLGKVTSGADWLVADALGVEKIDPTGWSLVQNHLREWTASPTELQAGDQQSTEHLVEGLIMSGLGMQSYESSRTASGAEHQFSHLWEMEGLGKDAHPPLSHGFKVGVGSVAIAALYELLLERDLAGLDIETLRDAWPTREEMEQSVRAQHTSPELEEGAVEQTLAKYISADELAERLEMLREVWPELREKVRAQLMPAEEIKEMLGAAGCPTTPVEIGLGWKDFEKTYRRAQTIRKRYTVLDLAFEAGLLDECVEELFAPEGFWGRVAASRAADGAGDERGTVRAGHRGGFPPTRPPQSVVALEEAVDVPRGTFGGRAEKQSAGRIEMEPRVPQDIERQVFDVIVIGAGINGAGIARDAAMRGLRVLLLDKGDIAAGTTQWATRLIHGGLRYLEHYEFALVRESLRDREALLHIAPHLVKPLGFLVPIYKGSSHGPLMIRMGMNLYDTLSYDKSMDRHKMLGRKKVEDREPGLNPEGLKGAAFYYDAQVEYPERVAVENAISARDHGATVITYANVENLVIEEGYVKGVEFTDVFTGESHTARAPVTVNVAGPWVDEVLAELQVPGTDKNVGRFMGGTKGSHLIVDAFPGAPKGEALYVEARKDGRPYFIVPWNGRYLIGTTDLRYEEDLDYVKASEEEIEYLLDETNHVIPEANLTRDDVLFTYAGVRPLPYSPEGETGGVTRSHVVFDHATGDSAAGGKVKSQSAELPPVGGLLSIIGGKLTTYLNLSRQTTDAVFKKLDRKASRSRSRKAPLPGSETADFGSFVEGFKAASMIPDVLRDRLLKLYGVRAAEVLAIGEDDPELLTPLSPIESVETALIGAEVIWAFREEMAETLSDVLLRRTMTGYGPRVALDVVEPAAQVAVKHLGWDEERAEREVNEYREWIERYTPKEFRDREPSPA